MTKLLCLLAILPSLAFAESAEEKGIQISQEMEHRDDGFGDFTAKMSMVLRDKKGREITREIFSRTKEVKGDGDKSMTIFKTPRSVSGTAMLTYTHKEGIDDQWLYLPKLKRVKRIVSRNKSGSFMGSEFAYEDLSSLETEKFKHKFLREEPCGEKLTCFVTERVPVDKYSGYSRQEVWVDKERYIPIKIFFYDRKKSHLKTLEFKGYQQYLGKFWRASSLVMSNHLNKKHTELVWSEYKFQTGLSDRDFGKNSLKRAR